MTGKYKKHVQFQIERKLKNEVTLLLLEKVQGNETFKREWEK